MKQVYISILMSLLSAAGVVAQNNSPVATGETIMPVYGPDIMSGDTTITINVLINDQDPDGEAIELAEVRNRKGQSQVEITFTDSIISLTMSKSLIQEQGYDYRVREVDDPSSLSNWATLVVNPCVDPNYPVARNDTVTGMRGYELLVNVLENDSHPLGDTLMVLINSGEVLNGSVQIHCPAYDNDRYYRLMYQLTDTIPWYQRFDFGVIYIQLLNSEFYDSLDVNNVNARMYCFGNHFWDFDGASKYFVPNGTLKTSLFSQALWIGGLDANNHLHLAGERYRQVGVDFWPGPVSDVYDSLYDSRWLHVWKLNRDDIEYHKAHWWEAGYEPIFDIATWPGNGDTELGQSEHIAPFEDQNNNGIYEPMEGDAPVIKGDQALYFVYNDDRGLHTETNGIPLGIEIHAMAYAYNMPEDSALWSTIFLNYKIINRSDTSYHNAYVGVFTDTDLGFAWDDYVGCDVQRGMYFTYNGTPNDNGGPESYGNSPPAQGILFLGGPFMDEDGIDNPKLDGQGNQMCDESINGLNFGDSIVDNERYGMTNFMYFNNSGASWTSDPYIAPEYYTYLQSIWRDGTPCIYGGNGHPTAGGVGPECRFMFPGDSDTCNWGTGGVPPNGGYNQPGMYWTEELVGNYPSDRRGLGSSGPFTFEPGEVHYLDLALVWARAYDGNPWSSALLLKERASYLKEMFENDENFFSGIYDFKKENQQLRIYPNPATSHIHLLLPEETGEKYIQIINSTGQMVYLQHINERKSLTIDLNNFKTGLYFIRLVSGDEVYSGRIIKK